jgi:hypothetical protein
MARESQAIPLGQASDFAEIAARKPSAPRHP